MLFPPVRRVFPKADGSSPLEAARLKVCA